VTSFSYEKSAQCFIRANEASDVSISIVTVGDEEPEVVWGIFELSGADGGMEVKGIDLGAPLSTSPPWSIDPLRISKSDVIIKSFSVPGMVGHGPSHRGALLLTIYLWAIESVDALSLINNGEGSTYFSFAGQSLVELKPQSTTAIKWNGAARG